MRILFTRFPLESAHGGAEVQTMSLMRGLKERGHDVQFLGSCPVLLKLCKAAGIDTHALDIGSPPVTEILAASFAWRQRGMRRLLTDALDALQKPDAVVMLSMSEKLLLTADAKRRGCHVLWLEHDRVGRWLRWNPWLPLLRRLAASATTVCVSGLSKSIYLHLGWPDHRIVAIPNGIDLTRFTVTKNRRQKHETLHIGCVARLTHDKGVDLLVQAVATQPQATLHIVGKGPEESHLRAMIENTHCKERITLQPQCDDLGAFYQECDVLVLPSREHDPFGLVAAEAMAMGTPVIVTDACGIAEYVEPGTGLVVPAGDAGALCKALHECENISLRTDLSKGAQELAHRKFGLETMVSAYEHLLAA
jgi:glycosyltransferase involved in cell wall biosynthesis